MDDDYEYSEIGADSEGGATAGQTHLRVLEGVIGHERALASITASGPPHAPAASARPSAANDGRGRRRQK